MYEKISSNQLNLYSMAMGEEDEWQGGNDGSQERGASESWYMCHFLVIL